jgi:hypothetical protein
VETATEFQLKLVRWQFFVTVTWSASQLGSYQSRETDFWNWMRDWALREKLRLAQLPIALRWERGEHGDRPHAHALIAGFDRLLSVSENTCWRQMRKWEQYGFARVYQYDPYNPANIHSYVSKLRANRSRANQYEIGKFDMADRLCINDAAWKLMLQAVDAPYMAQTRTL